MDTTPTDPTPTDLRPSDTPPPTTARATGRSSRAARLLVATLVAALLAAAAMVTGPGAAPAAAATRNPVVIVAGMGVPSVGYEPLAARLRLDGYRVTIFQSSTIGLGDIRDSARQLSSHVASVRAATGAAKVDLVGHSAGGLVSREYVKNLGGSTTVDKVVTLGTPHYGTVAADVGSFFGLGPCALITACTQLTLGNSYLAGLNAGDDSIGSVRYWAFSTTTDEVVQPFGNALLNAADGNIVNTVVQRQCWLRFVGHAGLILEGPTYTGIRQALSGSTTIRLNCFAL